MNNIVIFGKGKVLEVDDIDDGGQAIIHIDFENKGKTRLFLPAALERNMLKILG